MKELILIIVLLLLYNSDQPEKAKVFGTAIITGAYFIADADTAIVDTVHRLVADKLTED